MKRLRTGVVVLCLLLGAGVRAEEVPPPFEDGLAPVPSVESRLGEIRRLVQEAVVYPEPARRRGLTGVARIRFRVGPDGRAAGVATAGGSGHALLDSAAEQGARDARDLPHVFGLIEVPIRFSLDQ